ncbi:hypothetical protein ABTY20_26245, partial [Streptomyces sp. NPDC126497]
GAPARARPAHRPVPVADPVTPAPLPSTGANVPAAEAPTAAAAPASPSAEGLEPALRSAQELDLTLAGGPSFHNAEQAARVIEELTAAVRNIALCLNNPATRERP